MIRYALKCNDEHGFESWFQSAEAYEELRAGGLVACPDCGSTDVDKAIMAPRVRPSRKASQAAPAIPADKQAILKKLKDKIEKNSDYVGTNFAHEARAIHDGTAPERAIYGEARFDEAKKLIDDGIPVAPLPFVPSRKVS